jgi:hypothetical protein
MRDYWEPAVRGAVTHTRRPEAGMLIAFDRKPWRVVEVKDKAPVDWSDEVRDYWQQCRMPDPWELRPYNVLVTTVSGGKVHHLSILPWHQGWWAQLPEHYAVCVSCGELAPCMEITAERNAKEQMRRFELLANVLPGCCWGCAEPITSRQKAHWFPGPNVWMPTAPDGVRIHERAACHFPAERYENDWVAADPSRPRSLLTLTCKGTRVTHHDGTSECFGADDSECPDLRARHAVSTACYAQSHGCPRECPREGHPGIRYRA